MAKIPFIDLKAQYRRLEDALRARIEAVLEHGTYIMGPEVAELEAGLAAFTGTTHALTCSSGTDALLMALMAKGIGAGDAVLTTPFTFVATAEAVALLGATPVFVDVDPDTYNLDPMALERTLTALDSGKSEEIPLPRAFRQATPPEIKAVLTVDIFGVPCDHEAVARLVAPRGLCVIEDAAQSFGATADGRRTCSLGEIGCTSFFPAKPLGCYGDGGAVFTNDDALADVLRSIRIHGKGTDKYDNIRIGLNGRLDTLQAAILLPKLAVLPDELEQRRRVAAAYAAALAPASDRIRPQRIPAGMTSAYAQYALVADSRETRDGLLRGLKEADIPTAVYYPRPLHLQTAFAGLGYRPGDFPMAEGLSERILNIPMHPYMEADTIETIAARILHILA